MARRWRRRFHPGQRHRPSPARCRGGRHSSAAFSFVFRFPHV